MKAEEWLQQRCKEKGWVYHQEECRITSQQKSKVEWSSTFKYPMMEKVHTSSEDLDKNDCGDIVKEWVHYLRMRVEERKLSGVWVRDATRKINGGPGVILAHSSPPRKMWEHLTSTWKFVHAGEEAGKAAKIFTSIIPTLNAIQIDQQRIDPFFHFTIVRDSPINRMRVGMNHAIVTIGYHSHGRYYPMAFGFNSEAKLFFGDEAIQVQSPEEIRTIVTERICRTRQRDSLRNLVRSSRLWFNKRFKRNLGEHMDSFYRHLLTMYEPELISIYAKESDRYFIQDGPFFIHCLADTFLVTYRDEERNTILYMGRSAEKAVRETSIPGQIKQIKSLQEMADIQRMVIHHLLNK